MNNEETKLRHPYFLEGLSIFKLIRSCPPLDLNSAYYYYILCRDFADTCVVAESEGRVVGFISAYLRPRQPDCIFVWQVAVDPDFRGRQIASSMLEWLIKQLHHHKIRTMETTVSPSNQPSQALFRGFTQRHQASLETSEFLRVDHFEDPSHEGEILFTITF
ncbi:MAG: diaminobutyrate acetyltransferase [Dehalococcoidia bacterium]|nr:diaminobutyrate acetyltransferase [Dehalococcoidia bacterium]